MNAIHEAHKEGLAHLKKTCKRVEKIRLLGTIAAFDVNGQDLATLKEAFLREGLLVRPLGNMVYLLPPYSTTPTELLLAYQVIEDVVSRGV